MVGEADVVGGHEKCESRLAHAGCINGEQHWLRSARLDFGELTTKSAEQDWKAAPRLRVKILVVNVKAPGVNDCIPIAHERRQAGNGRTLRNRPSGVLCCRTVACSTTESPSRGEIPGATQHNQ